MAEPDVALTVEPPRSLRVPRQPREESRAPGVDPAPSRDRHIEVDLEDDDGHVVAQDDAAKRLADQAKALKASEDALAAERAARVAAERAAGTAAAERVSEREATLNATIESTKSMVTNAESAMKAAFDAGDMDAYAKASADFTRGNVRLENLEIEKSRVAAQKTAAPRPGAGQPPPSAEAQRWLETHPRFGADPEYQARATAAHNYALARGMQAGSPEYIQTIETTLESVYGPNHGTLEAMRAREAPTRQPRAPRSSTATPSNRGSAIDVGNAGELKYDHGEGKGYLRLVTLGDGRQTVEGTIPSEWVQAAKMTGFVANRSGFKTDAEGAIGYAVEQLRIMQDQKGGHDTGLQIGDGGIIYR